ncbi:MAG: hypothetical protein QOJ63_767 [Solirubrobacteraceae bacterium]|nr:hypothetical protein [Solirubrobacteraceae bacterium]
MSASARGTATDYSKGSAPHRANVVRARRLLAATALAGAAVLLVAELSPLYTVVVGSLQAPRRSVSAGSEHGYALAIVALATVAMAAGALRGGRAAAAAVAALGAVALLVALLIDLPATRRSAGLPESIAFAGAHARAAGSFALEIAGALALLVSGALMLALASVRRGA